MNEFVAAKLYYIHDPMCSWCWAFKPVWDRLRSILAEDLEIVYLLGGLAADTDEDMPEPMREYIQSTWRRIAAHNGTAFNHDFWFKNRPKRSTYPACRAVIAARRQDRELTMIESIQRAYYLEARNPSDNKTLSRLAQEMGLDREKFIKDLNSTDTSSQLLGEIAESTAMGVNRFPSLIMEYQEQFRPVDIDYQNMDVMRDYIYSMYRK